MELEGWSLAIDEALEAAYPASMRAKQIVLRVHRGGIG